MPDTPAAARAAVIGLATFPERTLVDRAMDLMAAGPLGADRLAREVLGLVGAPAAVAERLAVALFAADPRVTQLGDGRWALVAEASGSPLIEDSAFAVVDVETTGMSAWRGDRVMEIAVVVVQGPRRELVFDSLLDPGMPIPPRIGSITGITPEMVARAPAFEEVADALLAALAGRVFVAHNARFDWAFLSAEVRRTRGLRLASPRLCTVRLARRLLPQLESGSLDRLTEFFCLENPARHRAAGDALATAQLLERLLPYAREQGARTVADLEMLTRKATRKQGDQATRRRGDGGPGGPLAPLT